MHYVEPTPPPLPTYVPPPEGSLVPASAALGLGGPPALGGPTMSASALLGMDAGMAPGCCGCHDVTAMTFKLESCWASLRCCHMHVQQSPSACSWSGLSELPGTLLHVGPPAPCASGAFGCYTVLSATLQMCIPCWLAHEVCTQAAASSDTGSVLSRPSMP